MNEIDQYGYHPGEAEDVLTRISQACINNPVSLEDVLKSAEFIAACTSFGLRVTDVLWNGVCHYPHLMAKMAETWDMSNIAGELPS